MSPIIPSRIFPIGEEASGERLCASVTPEGVDWFPEHRDFDLAFMDAVPVALDSSDFLSVEVDDAAPTLKDEDLQELMGNDLPYMAWN